MSNFRKSGENETLYVWEQHPKSFCLDLLAKRGFPRFVRNLFASRFVTITTITPKVKAFARQFRLFAVLSRIQNSDLFVCEMQGL